MSLILYLTIAAIYLIYKWGTSKYDYFEKQGIPFRKPYPFLGTSSNMLLRRRSFMDMLSVWYDEYKDRKVSGLFDFLQPTVFIRDPKIVKQLTTKDFDFFIDRRIRITEDADPLIGKSLPLLKGQKWKDMRATLSPAFTGSKMRQMFGFVSQVGMQSASAIKNDIKSEGEKSFEFKALATKFTVDLIASTAFGIEVNTFKNPDNDFHRIAKKITNFRSFVTALKLAGYKLIPRLMNKLKIRIMDAESCDFFQEAIIETMKVREEKGIIRHDMINLLIQAKKGRLSHNNNTIENISDGFATVEESQLGKSQTTRKWNDDELAAQSFLFFLAGFETVAATMSFIAYELTCNPDVQQKLFEEIQSMNNDNEGKAITYEQIQSMKYLDQVVCETLRKWPAVPMIDRVCVKNYDLKYDDKVLHIEKNMNIMIPIWSFHHDPKYFPEPEKFNPDRFSVENRESINPDTYLPFGIGPRNCIGSRFTLMELKTIFFYLLLNFSFEVCKKTQIPLRFEKLPIPLGMKPEKDIWLTLKVRDF